MLSPVKEESGTEWKNPKKLLIEVYTFAIPRQVETRTFSIKHVPKGNHVSILSGKSKAKGVHEPSISISMMPHLAGGNPPGMEACLGQPTC